jgi:hypothetical protein
VSLLVAFFRTDDDYRLYRWRGITLASCNVFRMCNRRPPIDFWVRWTVSDARFLDFRQGCCSGSRSVHSSPKNTWMSELTFQSNPSRILRLSFLPLPPLRQTRPPRNRMRRQDRSPFRRVICVMRSKGDDCTLTEMLTVRLDNRGGVGRQVMRPLLDLVVPTRVQRCLGRGDGVLGIRVGGRWFRHVSNGRIARR